MTMKTHYLEGVKHEALLGDRTVVTTWTTKRGDANRIAEKFRSDGADLARVFSDGRAGWRVVGYFFP